MKLTDAELRELLELEAVATSAPWQVQGCGGIQMDGSRDGYMIENAAQRRIALLYRKLRALDARLITTARNLARPLAEEVLRLRCRLTTLKRLALRYQEVPLNADDKPESWGRLEELVEEALRDAD